MTAVRRAARGYRLIEVSVAGIQKEPSHAAELVTQAVMGERVRVLAVADEGRWLRVRLPDGYEGWLRSWLAAPDRAGWPGSRVAEIDAPWTWVYPNAGHRDEPVSDVVIGTRLAATGRAVRGWQPVELPDGRTGVVACDDLLRGRPIGGARPRRPARAPALLATARRFLGVPYVWGGKSPKGFDCSGLTQLVHELHGLELPRDSKDQDAWMARHARAIADPLAVPPGGLLFFGAAGRPVSHVGFSLGEGRFLHSQGRVRQQTLDPSKPEYHKDLAAVFRRGFEPHPGIAGAGRPGRTR
jgi:cell wall-associated NlpC family hydrolase